MKKNIGILLFLLLTAFAYAGVARASGQDILTSGDYKYVVLDDGTAEIVSYSGKDEFLVIPDMINGKKVTSIGTKAFYQCHYLTEVTVPDGVTCIGKWAFDECKHLRSIALPGSLTVIEDRAFCYCYSLSGITIPDSVTDIGEDVFANCPFLTVTVSGGSRAEQYCADHGIPYVYPGSGE